MNRTIAAALAILLMLSTSNADEAADFLPKEVLDFAAMRADMVRIVRLRVASAAEETGVAEIDSWILKAMREVPRHAFVPDQVKLFAYFDTPLPLGFEQNISQPFIIALMTQLAQVKAGDVVFETGTGAGYHAAILSKRAARVNPLEVVGALAQAAREALRRVGIDNAEVRVGDGYYGWPERGPYDAIIVKEAVNHIPPPLVNQLKPGGRMVLPIGLLDTFQHLSVVEKDLDGELSITRVLPVRFTPLQGGKVLNLMFLYNKLRFNFVIVINNIKHL